MPSASREQGDLFGAEEFRQKQPAFPVEVVDLLLRQFHGFLLCNFLSLSFWDTRLPRIARSPSESFPRISDPN
jgi:hypothetical protein